MVLWQSSSRLRASAGSCFGRLSRREISLSFDSTEKSLGMLRPFEKPRGRLPRRPSVPSPSRNQHERKILTLSIPSPLVLRFSKDERRVFQQNHHFKPVPVCPVLRRKAPVEFSPNLPLGKNLCDLSEPIAPVNRDALSLSVLRKSKLTHTLICG